MAVIELTCSDCGGSFEYDYKCGVKPQRCKDCAYLRMRHQQDEWRKDHADQRRGLLAAQAKAWQEANPERVAYLKRKAVAAKFGLTPEQYNNLRAQGCCDVCGSTAPGGNRGFYVDHDRACCPGDSTCGKCVRGLLCLHCNLTIGKLEKRPELIDGLLDWVRRNPRLDPSRVNPAP